MVSEYLLSRAKHWPSSSSGDCNPSSLLFCHYRFSLLLGDPSPKPDLSQSVDFTILFDNSSQTAKLARWLIIFTVIAATSVAEGHSPLERSNVSPLSLPFDPSPATLYSSSDLLLLLIITPHYRCSSSFGGYNPLVMTRPPLSSSITSRRSRLHGRRLSAPNSLLLVPVGETHRHHPTLLGRQVRQCYREEAGCTVGGRALQIPRRLDPSLGQIWVFPSSSYAWLVTSAATNPQPYAPVPATSSLDIR